MHIHTQDGAISSSSFVQKFLKALELQLQILDMRAKQLKTTVAVYSLSLDEA